MSLVLCSASLCICSLLCTSSCAAVSPLTPLCTASFHSALGRPHARSVPLRGLVRPLTLRSSVFLFSPGPRRGQASSAFAADPLSHQPAPAMLAASADDILHGGDGGDGGGAGSDESSSATPKWTYGVVVVFAVLSMAALGVVLYVVWRKRRAKGASLSLASDQSRS